MFRINRWFWLGVALFSAVCLTLFYQALSPKKSLPIYATSMVNPELVDSTVQHIEKNHRIPRFALTNQYGQTVTEADYRGKVYVADFFFTTCQSICPKMSHQFQRIQMRFAANPEVRLLSHSVMPEVDRVPVLRHYAAQFKAKKGFWNLVRGADTTIYRLARRAYLAVKTANPAEYDQMVHTENFILVDRKGRIRGFYDGTQTEAVNQLMDDMDWLLAHPEE